MSISAALRLNGQWVGQSLGDPTGTMILDLDEVGDNAVGHGYIFPHEENALAAFLKINLDNQLVDTEFDGEPVFFRSADGYVPTTEEMKAGFPETIFPKKASVKVRFLNNDMMEVQWESSVDSHGMAKLRRAGVAEKSMLAAEQDVGNWKTFIEYVTEKLDREMIFRGQSNPWPLRTSFHRSSRKDLYRYLTEDIPRLHRALTGQTNHVFNLMNAQENGAFLSLAQHHGFPTPLLDWTRSPFVAAYFAFSSVDDVSGIEPVRIYAFDFERYSKNQFQSQNLAMIKPHISVLEALSIENNRAVPQQGLLTLTNLHDIEEFMEFVERGANERYLFAFDLPRSEAPRALADLRLMGITQSSLFPGIDSICRDLRSRFFDFSFARTACGKCARDFIVLRRRAAPDPPHGRALSALARGFACVSPVLATIAPLERLLDARTPGSGAALRSGDLRSGSVSQQSLASWGQRFDDAKCEISIGRSRPMKTHRVRQFWIPGLICYSTVMGNSSSRESGRAPSWSERIDFFLGDICAIIGACGFSFIGVACLFGALTEAASVSSGQRVAALALGLVAIRVVPLHFRRREKFSDFAKNAIVFG